MYGWSILHCLPVGRVERPSAETGTAMRESTFRRYAEEAGFTDIQVVPPARILALLPATARNLGVPAPEQERARDQRDDGGSRTSESSCSRPVSRSERRCRRGRNPPGAARRRSACACPARGLRPARGRADQIEEQPDRGALAGSVRA